MPARHYPQGTGQHVLTLATHVIIYDSMNGAGDGAPAWSCLVDLAQFSAELKSNIAQTKRNPGFAHAFWGQRMFINHAYNLCSPAGMTLREFKQALLAASQGRHLSITRCDVPELMNAADVAESEVRRYGAEFHFIAC